MFLNRLAFFLLVFCFFSLILKAQQLNLTKIDEICSQAVVYIKTPDGLGTGFLINDEGYILTNFHVISFDAYGGQSYAYSADKITVEFKNGKIYDCVSSHQHEQNKDIALLKINLRHKVQPLPLSAEPANNGMEVAAIGHPKGVKFSINKGSVSNISPVPNYDFVMQTDVSVNPGNSGGPLIAANGLVMGMIFSRYEKQSIWDRDVQNMNFAIHAQDIRSFLKFKGIKFNTTPLISVSELGGRKLTAEEEAAAKAAELQRIANEQNIEANKTELEKQRIAEQSRLEKIEAENERKRLEEQARIQKEKAELEKQKNATVIQRSTEQELKLQNQSYEYQQQQLKAQHLLDLQRIEEQKQREWMRLEQDKVNLARAQDQQKQNRKVLYQNFPAHIGFKFGAGAFYELGTLQTDFNTYDEQRTVATAQAVLGYRFDLNDKKLGYRGSFLGVFGRLNILNNNNTNIFLQEQQFVNFSGFSQINLGSDLEFGGIWRDWLRASFGSGFQKITHSNQSLNMYYYSSTVSFIPKISKSVELELYFNTIFAKNLNQPMFRAGLCLNFYLAMGRW